MKEKLYRVKPITFVPQAGYGYSAEDRFVAQTPYGELTLYRDVSDHLFDDRKVWFFEDVNAYVSLNEHDTRDEAEAAAVQWYIRRATECMEEVT